METELTKKIKRYTHFYKPKMSTGQVGRTIRYADEVWTPNGIVDSIRFEDYIESKHEECKLINFEMWKELDPFIRKMPKEKLGRCKVQGCSFPNSNCAGCFYRVKEVQEIGILITAYEVKITKADFKSKHGHNIDNPDSPIANENYYCVPKDLVKEIADLVPEHVGILSYTGNGLRCVKKSGWLEVPDETKVALLYSALKKWCDGKM